ncbi:MAG: hypothetical protein QOG85_1045 [Gaiellaceae bacterium]|jgi:hypothetical protein|nr:hypothetical protein [Gaiellaceae bacterium]
MVPIVAAVVGAAFAALAVTGVFGGTSPSRGPIVAAPRATQGGLEGPWDSMSVAYTRDGGTLSSVSVTVNPDIADASIQVEVLHNSATARGAVTGGNTDVVYESPVFASTATGSKSGGLSTWSGSFSPSDWSGGCQSGTYNILAISIPPGLSFAEAAETNESARYYGPRFTCTG